MLKSASNAIQRCEEVQVEVVEGEGENYKEHNCTLKLEGNNIISLEKSDGEGEDKTTEEIMAYKDSHKVLDMDNYTFKEGILNRTSGNVIAGYEKNAEDMEGGFMKGGFMKGGNAAEEVKQIIANMMFNMGRPRLSKFKGMKAGVDARDWNKAADEMVDSGWYRQVTNRAQRLVDRMRIVNIV